MGKQTDLDELKKIVSEMVEAVGDYRKLTSSYLQNRDSSILSSQAKTLLTILGENNLPPGDSLDNEATKVMKEFVILLKRLEDGASKGEYGLPIDYCRSLVYSYRAERELDSVLDGVRYTEQVRERRFGKKGRGFSAK